MNNRKQNTAHKTRREKTIINLTKLNSVPLRARVVYRYLYDHCDHEHKAWPSVKTMVEDLLISESSIRRAMKDLEDVGLIRKEYTFRENGGCSSNLYYLIGM